MIDEHTKKAIRDSVQEAFAAGIGSNRYIDVSRVSLICQSIVGINDKLGDLQKTVEEKLVTQDQFWPVKTIAYGLIGILAVSVVTAIIMSVIRQ